MCYAILSAHALTACDTTSAFYGLGKGKAIKKFKKLNDDELRCLACLGENLSSAVIKVCTKFVCLTYDESGKYTETCGDINEFCLKLSTSKVSSIQSLPPSYPALLL